MIKNAPCHSTAGGDFVTMARSLSLKFKSCAQDNRSQIETGQKWKARVGKPAILGCLRETLDTWEKRMGRRVIDGCHEAICARLDRFLWNLRSFECRSLGQWVACLVFFFRGSQPPECKTRQNGSKTTNRNPETSK